MDLSNENVIHIKKNGIEYLQFTKLLKYKDIVTHAYTLGTNINYRTSIKNITPLPPKEFDKAIKNYKTICRAESCAADYFIADSYNWLVLRTCFAVIYYNSWNYQVQ